jgi:hypothetical protein
MESRTPKISKTPAVQSAKKRNPPAGFDNLTIIDSEFDYLKNRSYAR